MAVLWRLCFPPHSLSCLVLQVLGEALEEDQRAAHRPRVLVGGQVAAALGEVISVRPPPRLGTARQDLVVPLRGPPGSTQGHRRPFGLDDLAEHRPRTGSRSASGPWIISARHAPPGRGSIATRSSGIDEPCSPNHAANRSGSVHALNTSSRAASNIGRSRSRRRRCAAETTPSGGRRVSHRVLLPSSWTARRSARRAGRSCRPRTADTRSSHRWPPQGAGRAAGRDATAPYRPAGDQTGALEHLQVLRDRLQAHRERLGQLVDGRLAPPAVRGSLGGWIGERRERAAEFIDRHAGGRAFPPVPDDSQPFG